MMFCSVTKEVSEEMEVYLRHWQRHFDIIQRQITDQTEYVMLLGYDPLSVIERDEDINNPSASSAPMFINESMFASKRKLKVDSSSSSGDDDEDDGHDGGSSSSFTLNGQGGGAVQSSIEGSGGSTAGNSNASSSLDHAMTVDGKDIETYQHLEEVPADLLPSSFSLAVHPHIVKALYHER
jgi:hypothetical protein